MRSCLCRGQVEPVKWPAERMRKVLNNAILTGLVADEMITAAEQALTDGFEGSLSRCAATPQLLSTSTSYSNVRKAHG